MDVSKLLSALTPEQRAELKAELNKPAGPAPAAPAKFVPPAGLSHSEHVAEKTAVAIEDEVQVDNFLSTEPSAPVVASNPFLSKPLPTTSHEIIRDEYFNTGEVNPDNPLQKPALPSAPPLPPPPAGWMPNKEPVLAKPGQPLTLADTTGPALKDEFDRARARERSAQPKSNNVIKQARANVDLSDPMVAMCPKELREPQPNGFNPYDLLNRRIREFLAQPTLKGGLSLTNRVVFEQKDRPSVSIENAVMFGFAPIVPLGRALSSGATKLYLGYAQPGPETLTEALRVVLTTLKNWALGREFVPEKEAAANVSGSMRRTDGSVITDASGRAMRPSVGQFVFKPKIYVFQPLDYTEQAAVVIA